MRPIQALVSNKVPLSLSAAVDLAAAAQPVKVDAKARGAVLEFVARRLEQLLVDAGVPPEAGEAALGREGLCFSAGLRAAAAVC